MQKAPKQGQKKSQFSCRGAFAVLVYSCVFPRHDPAFYLSLVIGGGVFKTIVCKAYLHSEYPKQMKGQGKRRQLVFPAFAFIPDNLLMFGRK
jgi:hypothetical protein